MTGLEARTILQDVIMNRGKRAILTPSRSKAEATRLQLTRSRRETEASFPGVKGHLKFSTQYLGESQYMVVIEWLDEVSPQLQVFNVLPDGTFESYDLTAKIKQLNGIPEHEVDNSNFELSGIVQDKYRRLVMVWLQDNEEGTFEQMCCEIGLDSSDANYRALWDSLT
jgi:hypothetical protein